MNFSDEYFHHQSSEALYFPQSFPTEEVSELYEYNLEGCCCTSGCHLDTHCKCNQRSGTFYEFTDVKILDTYRIQEKGYEIPTYECNDNCICSKDLCGNRLVQFGPRKQLIVKKCENELIGLGLFTLSEIKKGSFICEYAGEIITEEEAKQRYNYCHKKTVANYIFCINEKFGEKVVKTFIDPTKYGNIGRYINHSCEPNSKLVVIRINDTIPILGIFANIDIQKNSEITYNYGHEFKNSENETSRKKCLCMSKICRKYLPYDMSL